MRKCHVCQENQARPDKAPAHPWETPKGQRVRLHIDYAGPYMGKMLYAYSKWTEVHCMNSGKSVPTINKLRKTFSTHGLPELIVSDNGPSFVNEEFEGFMRKKDTKGYHLIQY